MDSLCSSGQQIAVVGGGWYGCHIAIELAKRNHKVTLLEKNDQIVSGCSGSFGIRLHRGPHYPRSSKTRRNCQLAFDKFVECYPELIYWHKQSIYAYGTCDALGFSAKVSLEDFEKVCYETDGCRKVEDSEISLSEDVEAAYDLPEPSVALGERLRLCLEDRLEKADVRIICNAEVTSIHSNEAAVDFQWRKGPENHDESGFDFVVDATGYQSFRPADALPSGLAVVYQVCIAFDYKDRYPRAKPISVIVMDGWFPCLMPNITSERQPEQNRHGLTDMEEVVPGNGDGFENYVLLHGKYTILGTFKSPQDAHGLLKSLSPEDRVIAHLQQATASEMCRFWPEFKDRFTYKGWHGQVLAKPRTHCEYRSSVVFERHRLVHVVPGKISNVINASEEVVELIEGSKNIVADAQGWRYTAGGVLHLSTDELGSRGVSGARTTDRLQTYREFAQSLAFANSTMP